MAVERVSEAEVGPSVSQFRCTACAYVTSSRMAPERCPDCEGSVWVYDGPTVAGDDGAAPPSA